MCYVVHVCLFSRLLLSSEKVILPTTTQRVFQRMLLAAAAAAPSGTLEQLQARVAIHPSVKSCLECDSVYELPYDSVYDSVLRAGCNLFFS
jgi:hypothetical protein